MRPASLGLIMLLLVTAMINACGQKGDLYLPDPEQIDQAKERQP
jgi:predicted small lipoprotein YifL